MGQWTDLNDLNDFIPLTVGDRYQVVCCNPEPFGPPGVWMVLVMVPVFQVMTHVAVAASNELEALKNANEFVDGHYDELIAGVITIRNYQYTGGRRVHF